jgi:hypothetical protein
MSHTNGNVAAGGGGAAVIVLLLAHRVWHVELSAEEGAAIAVAVASGLLYLGRNGVRGIVRIVYRGQQN